MNDLTQISPRTSVDRVLTRSEQVSAAISAAVVKLLAERDLKDLTMDLVADHAGVGKAALYRRYPSKEAMAVDIFCSTAERYDPQSDSGDLRTDLGVFLRSTLRLLNDSIARRIVPELFALGHRDPSIGAMLRERLLKTRRTRALEMLRRGVERGELDPAIDANFLLDILAGGFYWRIFVTGADIDDKDIDAFVDALLTLGRPVSDHLPVAGAAS
jgi:AcrR family transcriptional regulator